VFAGRRPFSEIDLTPAVLPSNLGEFFADWNRNYTYEAVPSSDIPNPISYSSGQNYSAVFLSTRPKIHSLQHKYAYTVVSSRLHAWLEERRWWSIDEYAAIQGYPPTFDYSLPGSNLARMLLSKSVSPTITSYLTERVVVPYFNTDQRDAHRAIKVNLV
jgi:hypothetical protein